MVGPVRPQFVLFGSSIVQLSYSRQGWGAILSHLYARKADIVLRGYSGWNSRRALQVLDEIFPKNACEQPSLIIVYFGGNDSILPHPSGRGQHVPLQEYIENMRKIAIHLKSLSKKTRIIFLSAPPINEAQIYANSETSDPLGQRLRTNESLRLYSEVCLELCREMNIKAIDLWSAIQKRDNWRDVCFIDDGIHLSAEGSTTVAKEILKVLEEADWEPSLHWKSLPIEFEEESLKGEKWVVGPVRPQFVLFGSSIVQLSYSMAGWGAILTHLYARKADIVLRGYNGWNSRNALQVLDEIFPKNDSEQPSLVIVYFGGNDSILPHPSCRGQHVHLQEYIENMRKIAIHLKSLSKKTCIIFLSAPPVNEAQIYGNSDPLRPRLRTNESLRRYSEACLELCREMNIKAIDLWSAIQKRDNWQDVCFIDGIHLSAEGSKIVAKEILKVLEEAEWEPNLHWKSMPIEFGEDSPYDPIGPDGKTTTNVSSWTFLETTEWD
ncbi:GDSL esterase/lipase CPRD49-like isoform X2 [Gastrolobium bilobum]|uniref:GDSL esterase/lipase CPRD49-like isoform X2 n=1 Tax=Gastrolobium bilobum TaxID=150636 RepID=UPI002AAFD05A|nr:GDSL esterase/lipase CPRD49-like isoform X2 [Gastrolobium bilobum]